MSSEVVRSLPRAGELVAGRYRVGDVIGSGGMASVVEAIDEATGQLVAIKFLHVLADENIERLLREARLASRVESEHVVRVFDTGAHGARPFLVMERLVGEDFATKLRVRPLALADAVDCLLQCCDALAHAHAVGVVHRDIKVSNVFEHHDASGDTIVKVLDFGISRVFTPDAPYAPERTLTRTENGFLGSPPYMSPEHVRDPRTVDGRSDIWSLGVVAYRLLTRAYPFEGATTGEVLASILDGRPALLREHGAHVPDAIEAIVARCLARDRGDRYPDVGALAIDLAPFASPAMRSYGERVASVVRHGPVPSPAHEAPRDVRGSSRRAAFEPRTQTVPPPVASAPELDSAFSPSGEAPSVGTMVAVAPAGSSTRRTASGRASAVALPLSLAGLFAVLLVVVAMARSREDDPTPLGAATVSPPVTTVRAVAPATAASPSAVGTVLLSATSAPPVVPTAAAPPLAATAAAPPLAATPAAPQVVAVAPPPNVTTVASEPPRPAARRPVRAPARREASQAPSAPSPASNARRELQPNPYE